MDKLLGLTVLWGKKGAGKTLAALNSPYQPVHMIDVEGSSLEYEKFMDRLIKEKYFPSPFTRAACAEIADSNKELGRILADPKIRYGTICLDTVGQFAEWVKNEEFGKPGSEKISQIVWGKVRDRIRNLCIKLQGHCDLLLMTAHEREYPPHFFSPRCNPAIIELAGTSIRIIRQPNQKIPDAIIEGARLPFFPPKIPAFTLAKLISYIDKPANWDNLSEDEKAPPPPQEETILVPPEVLDDSGT